MKRFVIVVLVFCQPLSAFTQLEVSSGYAVNKRQADGPVAHVAFNIQTGNRIFLKPQAGYKSLHHFNDWVEADLKVRIIELHQTVGYDLVRNKKYILRPHAGINYRFYYWEGEMREPLNALPVRQYNIEFRNHHFLTLVSEDDRYKDEYRVSNFGFSFQVQNLFRLGRDTWLHITPFLEPDYDRSQNTGGCYAGVVVKF